MASTRRRPGLFSAAVVAALLLVAASACQLFVDLSGLSGGPEPTPDASGPDGASDGATDGATDARDGGFCATRGQSTFCDDFDTPPLGARWSSITAPGRMSLDPVDYRSPPNALRVDLDAILVPHLAVDLAPAQHFVVEADIKVETTEQQSDVDLIDLYFRPEPAGFTEYYLALVRFGTQYVLEMGVNGGGAQYFPFAGTFDIWRHYTLEVDLGAGTARVSLDGQLVLTKTIPVATSKGSQMLLGTPYADASTPWTLRFDNVTVANP